VKTFEVLLLPAAEAEAREAFLWYFERSPLAADAFRTEVFDAIDSLSAHATLWPEDENGFRRHVLRHFPYTVFYEVVEQTVNVMAIAHQRRRPGYWQGR
jgi:plasmid stabilization system protein ParE